MAATPEGTILPLPEAPAPDIDEAPDGGAPPPLAEEDDEEERRRRRRWILLFLLLIGLFILIIIAIWYFLFRQPLPLPIPNVFTPPGYTTSLYGAQRPFGLAVSPDGSRIYVAQTEGQRGLVVMDTGGNVLTTSIPGTAIGTGNVPVWMAIDPLTSELYVSDRPTGQVYVYDPNGAFLRTLTLAAPIPGWQPMGIAFDAAGNLYVTDVAGEAPSVEMFDRSLNLVRRFGLADKLSFPNGVAVDGSGNVYVADSNNGRLMAYRPDGSLLAQVGRGAGSGELGLPRGIAVTADGRIYVADSTGSGVLVYRLADGATPAIDYLGFFGGQGIEDGRFLFPNGIAADGRGRIYVSDTGNDRVQLWSY